MDTRGEEERYFSGQRSRACAVVLKTLAVVGVGLALAVYGLLTLGRGQLPDDGGIVACGVLIAFWILVMAAMLWGLASLLRSQRHIEENTRETAKALQALARAQLSRGTTKQGEPSET